MKIWQNNIDVIQLLTDRNYKVPESYYFTALYYSVNTKILDIFKSDGWDINEQISEYESCLTNCIDSNNLNGIKWLKDNDYDFPKSIKINKRNNIKEEVIDYLSTILVIENVSHFQDKISKIHKEWVYLTLFN